MLYSLDAGFRDAVLASWFQDSYLASLLRRDVIVVLLIGASGQGRLRESGLLGPTLKGACLLYSTRAQASPWRLVSGALEELTWGVSRLGRQMRTSRVGYGATETPV